MKSRNKQICLEIVSFTVGGIFLIVALFNMTVQYLAVLLVVEYFVSIANTIGWLIWVNKAEHKNGSDAPRLGKPEGIHGDEKDAKR